MCARDDVRSRLGRRTFLGALAAGGTAAMLATPATATPEAVGQEIRFEDPLTTGRTPDSWTVASPDGTLEATLDATGDQLTYRVSQGAEHVIADSELGLEFADGSTFGTEPTVTGSATDRVDRTWEPPWGRYAGIRERYNEVALSFDGDVPVTVTLRVFEDGVGVRYTIHGAGDFEIVDEVTEFAVATEGEAVWYNDNPNKYEQRIRKTAISEVGGANTPITMVTDAGTALSIHEADLTDYAAMRLSPDGDTRFRANLVTWPDGETKVRANGTHVSPWRTVAIGDGVGDLIESNLVVNLAQESKVTDPSWIDPGKYMGIWWELHIGESTWHPSDRVGATTENAKRYIDFCTEHDIPNLLAEGWNVGWDPGGLSGFDDQDFTQPTDQFDLQEVLSYGEQRGVSFVAHNETGAQAARYDENMADIFDQYQEWEIPAVKNGYVNPPFHNGQKQQSQWAVNHYRRMVATAAEHEIMVNPHEPIKPTGERRTWPNFMTREGVQGMEYQNFTGGLPAHHSVRVAQTRMLAGPVDYTPGIFDLTDDGFNVNTTRARQLSHYPVLFSGLQMVADLPKNYTDDAGETLPEFDFIEDVPAAWDETCVVDSELGEYVSIARRSGEVWYVGTQTGEERTLELELDFLEDGPYVAEIYADAPEASLNDNPEAVTIEERSVAAGGAIEVSMARGGGHAMRLVPADADIPYCPSLSVDAPGRADVGTTTISGTTDAESVRVEAGDDVLEPAVTDGEFAVEVPIEAGENTVAVSVPKRNADERCEEVVSIAGVDLLSDWSDPTGDDHGPGTYTYPTRDVFEDGDFDITGVTVHREGETYRFVATLATEPTDPWGFQGGFGKQFLQIYVRRPGDGGGSTEPAPGVNADLAAPYQIRVLADGENGVRVQDPTGQRLASGSVAAEGQDIVIDVPVETVGDLADAELAVLLLGYDGTEDDFTRAVAADREEWVIGGADGENAPRVMDLVTPPGTSNAEALAYSDDERATIPYRSLGAAPTVGRRPARDLDGDGRFEDVDGDGEATIGDLLSYFQHRDRDAITDEPGFDFDGDGQAGTSGDLFALYRELFGY